jgi:Ni,Fe-hydrogenase III large subunit
MDHHMGGGFMSMAALTRDLPRSLDGLPMEWLDVPFGPLFPGLPGGLDLVFTLDGDTVARTELRHETLHRELSTSWAGKIDGFPARVARLDPLAPTTYQVLACHALERAMGLEPAEDELRRRVASVERERAASHLTWLGRFGFLLGDAWLAQNASALARALHLADDIARFEALHSEVAAFARRVRRTPLLRRRLADVGRIYPVEDLVGPVARASGLQSDARVSDPTYKRLGYEPIVEQDGDARARLWLRLAEVEQSLDLVLAARGSGQISAPSVRRVSATGQADIETPRGAASLTLSVVEGQVADVTVEVPSQRLAALIESIARDRELADALLGVASLDLSPWELAH